MYKKIIAGVLTLACLGVSVWGIMVAFRLDDTLAYNLKENEAHNVITSGGVDITITEWMIWESAGHKELTAYPDEPIQVLPDTTVSKIVKIESLKGSSYVRADFEVRFSDAEGNHVDIPEETIKELVYIAPNAEFWTEKDGWYYYSLPLGDGAVPSSEPFFEEVYFSKDMSNEYQNMTVEVIITAQAVQTANNGNSALEAAWPADADAPITAAE